MSDQADKATEKKRQAVRSILGLYGRIARHYCPANSVVDAGVAILDELIRSAAPSSALVDAANKAIDSSHSDNPQDWLDAIDALRAALSAQEPKVCEWVDDDPFWIISCQKVGLSHSFHEPVIVRKWKACPYCTNPIEVKEG